jgi:hypothetical protein
VLWGRFGGTAGAALGVKAECRGVDVAVRTNGDAFDTAFYSFEFGVAWRSSGLICTNSTSSVDHPRSVGGSFAERGILMSKKGGQISSKNPLQNTPYTGPKTPQGRDSASRSGGLVGDHLCAEG